MTRPKPIKTPPHLARATREWWRRVNEIFQLEDHHRRLLTLAAEAWDRCEEARKVIDENGISYIDRFGAPRLRPEVNVERDARLSFARLIRELCLDEIEPPDSAYRPPRLTRRN